MQGILKSIDKKKSLYLVAITGIYFVIILALLQWNNESNEFRQLETYLSSQIEPNLSSENEYISRYSNESLVHLKIYSKDELKYWNKNSDAKQLHPNYSILKNVITGNEGRIELSLPFTNNSGNLHPEILKNIEAENTWKRIKVSSVYNFDLADKSYSFEANKARPLKWKLIVMLLVSFLYFTGFLILLTQVLQSLKFWQYIGSYLGIAVVFRYIFYLFSEKSSLDYLQIFSGNNELSVLSPSIADYILNSLIFIILTWSIYQYKKRVPFILIKQKWIWLTCLSCFTMLAYFYVLDSCYHLIFHSNIEIDVERVLQVDRYSITVLVILIINTFLVFLLHRHTIKSIKSQAYNWKYKIGLFLLTIVLCLPVILLLDASINYSLFIIFIAATSILLDLYLESKYNAISWNIWWIMIYAAFLTTSLFGFGFQKKTLEREVYLTELYKPIDSNTLESLKKIRSDKEVNSILQKLNSYDFPTKLDKVDVKQFLENSVTFKKILTLGTYDIQLFDENGTNMLLHQVIRKNAYLNQFKILREISPGLYFDRITGSYVLLFENYFKNNNGKALLAYISLLPTGSKKVKNDIPVAVYQNEKLLFQNKETSSIEADKYRSFSTGSMITNGKSVIVHIPEKQPSVKLISVSPIAKLIKPISLFSYLFCLIAILYTLFLLFNQFYATKFLPKTKDSFKLNTLRGKIQYSVVGIVIISFIIIGVITVYFFSNEMRNNNEIQLQKKVETVTRDIYSSLAPAVDNNSAISIINNNISEFSRKFDSSINIYDPKGALISSLDPNAPQRVPFDIFKKLTAYSQLIKDPTKGNNNNYFIPIKAIDNDITAIASISISDITSTREKIIEFIGTILNVYVFLFLLAGAIAISIATSITSPLSRLSENIRKTKLGKNNVPLEWDRKDEIGALINSHNAMVNQLESSARLLAKTERDMAWREMAQQVAHEIKNPLTPMKLSIQYLEKAIERDPVQAPELVEKVANTLIEQIDSLAEIAGEFSNFASMPKSNNEKILVNEVVETIHDLFRKREDMDIKMVAPLNDIYIFADKNQLLRVMNNLMKNSIQAIPNDRRGLIEIVLSSDEEKANISVKDNGKGISSEMKSKVFTPYFTTKNSGTGLGLAISANIIESFDGTLNFNSEVGKGTTFSIDIPLMHLRDNRDNTNRVFLD